MNRAKIFLKKSDTLGSYEKVNYLLRLRKQIERRMIIELLQRLSYKIPIDKYHYIGLGSIYFADFILFHKYLNIENMTSLEIDKEKKKRFKFNLPYKFIQLKMISSSEYLQKKAKWKDPLFIWLDYDSTIDHDIISDIKHVARCAKKNDIFITTIDADFSENLEDIEAFLTEYKMYIGSNIKVKEAKEDYPNVLHQIINSALNEGKKQRVQNIEIRQFLNLVYKDTSKMYTFGCIFESPDINILEDCGITELPFVSNDNNFFEINCPILTPKEKYYLDACINKKKECTDTANKTGIDKQILSRYSIFYKYYPQFFESIY